MGEFVVPAHDEILKGVARIHPGDGDFHRFVFGFLGGFAGGRDWNGLGFCLGVPRTPAHAIQVEVDEEGEGEGQGEGGAER